MLPIRPVLESLAGGVAASWVGLGSGIAILQTIIGPDAAVDVGLVVNVALLFGAVVAVFHAGSTFRSWLDTLRASEQERKNARAIEARLATAEKLIDRLLALQQIRTEDDDTETK